MIIIGHGVSPVPIYAWFAGFPQPSLTGTAVTQIRMIASNFFTGGVSGSRHLPISFALFYELLQHLQLACSGDPPA